MQEPNAIIKNDIEFILTQRTPGGYRKPAEEQRHPSMIPKEKFDKWFQQFRTISGASTKENPCAISPRPDVLVHGRHRARSLLRRRRDDGPRPPTRAERHRSRVGHWLLHTIISLSRMALS
jgi:hypothetical protein